MIRHSHGDDFLLITQHHHALLSGQLAMRFGAEQFARPEPFDSVMKGISQHDCGWPLHDDEEPTLNADHLPLHVFEAPIMLATRVWLASALLADKLLDPYSALLVSLHVLHLSLIAQEHAARHTPHELFEVNKFQHRQIELQEKLRNKLGLRIDLPLHHGVAAPGASAEEDRLLFNLRLLQAMDRLSLAVCCSEELFRAIDLLPAPGGVPMALRVSRPAPFAVRLDPWPFHAPRIELEVPCRRVPAKRYDDEAQFRQVYFKAPCNTVMVSVCAA